MTPAPDDTREDAKALGRVLAQLMQPLARLAVARGVPCAQVEEQLREAFVQAAREAHAQQPAHRMVSRISTVTGLNRRLVTKLVAQDKGRAQPRRSLAGEVYARWFTDPAWNAARPATPLTLPRQGEQASFEALARAVTQDVHPRSLLDEMVRLGLARWDAASDQVSLVPEAFATGADAGRLLSVLGNNVGDHLAAAVANVRDGGGTHFERAIFASGLSEDSARALRERLQTHWEALAAALVPELQQAVARDAEGAAPATHRLRVGLFEYHEPVPPADEEPA